MNATYDPDAAPVHRDERTMAVEAASYRLGYLVLAFGLLLDVAYRSMVRGESPWDLMALVVVAGAVSTGYQAWQRTLDRRWAAIVLATAAVAALVALVLATAGRP